MRTFIFHTLLLIACVVSACHSLEVGENYAIRVEDQDWLNSLFYIPATPRVRKEYRMLSDDERRKFHNAIINMKQDRTVVPNKYDLLVSFHARRPSRNSAHRGTGFLGWHRVFVLLVENAIQEQDPNVTVPYWDCTLDAVLKIPRDSILFSEDFMGNGDGHVITGPFKDWSVQTGKLYRTVGVLHAPLSDKNITHMFQQHYVRNISYPLFGKDEENVFELIHNRVHHWIGGEMKAIETAADDPIFHPYHSFVSLVWEEFRALQRKRGIDPESDWDEFYGQGRHHMYSPMGLGNLMAIDGASDIFSENIVFDTRPFCTRETVDCGSPYLYCNVTLEKCCPWTLDEYKLIKLKVQEANATVKDIIEPFIKSKLKKGFEELVDSGVVLKDSATEYLTDDIVDMFESIDKRNHQNEQKNSDIASNLETVFGIEEKHDHDHDHSEHNHDDIIKAVNIVKDESHDVEEYHDNEDKHNYHIVGGPGQITREKPLFEQYLEKYCLYILVGLLAFRMLFAILVKCKSDSCSKVACRARKQKYHMDGIVNVNFNEEENTRKMANGNLPTVRSDNVYTVTVVANGNDGAVNGTFVRFAKYNFSEQANDAKDKAETSTDQSHGNYMDMTCNSSNVPQSGKETELYEREPVNHEENEVDDFESRYNSIENENFDFIRAAIREAGEDDNDSLGDLFDTYDNLMFVEREKPSACSLDTGGDEIKNEADDVIQLDDGYVHYLPGTHM